MNFNYRFTRAAERDLRDISDYCIDTAGPEVALSVLTKVMETVLTLSGQPRAGTLAETFGRGIQRFPAGNYNLYYRIQRPERIQILHVFHAARDQQQAWDEAKARRHG